MLGTARDGDTGVKITGREHPDVVTLDLDLPGMSGLDTLDRIMHTCPTPVVILSGVSRDAAEKTLDAVNLGAVDFILKYVPGRSVDPVALRSEIITKVRTAASVKVIRSLRRTPALERYAGRPEPPADAGIDTGGLPQAVPGLIVIGASTGGPTALRELLSGLPPDIPAGIVVVQHMPALFTRVMAEQLNRVVGVEVREARHGDIVHPGCVLVVPGDRHLVFAPDGSVVLTGDPPVNGYRPSIDLTMTSAARIFGKHLRGVILTGMGRDGTDGLQAIQDMGGTTFAQNAETCVVDAMPGSAIDSGVIHRTGNPREIAGLLLVGRTLQGN